MKMSRLFPIALVCASFLSMASAQEKDDVPQPLQYTLEDVNGDVIIIPAGETRWETAEPGAVVHAGDELRLGPASEAVLFLNEDTVINLSEDTHLKVDQLVADPSGGFVNRLKLLAGRILSEVKNLSKSHSTFEVESGGVVCGVRGTVFEVSRAGDQVEAAAYEGEVDVQAGGKVERVKTGYRYGFLKQRVLVKRKLDRVEKERFNRWMKNRKDLRERYLKRLKSLKDKRRKTAEKRKIQIKKVITKRKGR